MQVQPLGQEDPPGEGNGNPFQYPCLENSMDRGTLAGYSSWGCKDLDMTEQLCLHTCSHAYIFLVGRENVNTANGQEIIHITTEPDT